MKSGNQFICLVLNIPMLKFMHSKMFSLSLMTDKWLDFSLMARKHEEFLSLSSVSYSSLYYPVSDMMLCEANTGLVLFPFYLF